jgi:hypothetical protein
MELAKGYVAAYTAYSWTSTYQPFSGPAVAIEQQKRSREAEISHARRSAAVDALMRRSPMKRELRFFAHTIDTPEAIIYTSQFRNWHK